MRRIYNKMNKRGDIEGCIFPLLAIIVVCALVAIMLIIAKASNDAAWNDGRCPDCEIEWTYIQTIGHKSSTTYMYYCKNCNKTIECDHVPDWNKVLSETTAETTA